MIHASAVGLDGLGRQHGRRAADWVLHHLANGLRAAVRDTDAVGRISSDSFLVVLPSTAVEGAKTLMRRLASAPRQIHAAGTHLTYQASFGVAAMPAPAQTTERIGAATLARLAERLMAAAQQAAVQGESVVSAWDMPG